MKCVACVFVLFSLSRLILCSVDESTTSSTIPLSVNTLPSTVATSSVNTSNTSLTTVPASDDINPLEYCPSNVACNVLGGDCINCIFNTSCWYGSIRQAQCSPKPDINCTGDRVFVRNYECRYCYQVSQSKYRCNQSTTCIISAARHYYPARSSYTSLCTVHDEMLCLGRRRFYKEMLCNWTSGYKWITAFILSITLGGFGVDRFYLGLWREGLGKLFSFGGLGVWTLVDVILIGVGYIGPSDGSLYI